MNDEENMDTVMSSKELKELWVRSGKSDIADKVEPRSTIEEIKNKHGLPDLLRFRKCKQFSNSVISWVSPENSIYEDLILVRISGHTAKKVKKSKETEIPFDLLSDYFAEKGRTSKGITYFELHIIAHNEFDPYDEPVDLDPDGSKQNDARRELYGGFDNGDWGGLSGEEAEIGYWNCD